MTRYSIIVCLLLLARGSYGQIAFNINASNIMQTSLSLDQATNIYTSPIISLVPTISIRSDAGYLTGGDLPVSLFTAKIIGTSGNLLNLLSATQTVTLSTTAQNAYGQVLSLLQNGAINWRYTAQGWRSYALKAGAYSAGVTFGTAGIGQGTLAPTTTTITLNVAAFLAQSSTVSGIQFNINSLNYFRSASLSSANDVTVTTTVPYNLRLKASAANLSFSNGYAGATDPQVPVSRIAAQLTTAGVNNTLNLHNSYQNLTPNGGNSIPTGNQQVNTVTIKLNPADLKAAFMVKGQYNTTLNYELSDSQSSAQASPVNFACPLSIIVDELTELKVNQTDVNLNYNTAGDYAQGVKTEVDNHLTLSSTVPYDVYIKANSANMTNGSQVIPVNIIDITPVSAVQGGTLSTVSLSTSAQKIITGGTPDIDRAVTVRYAIPASRSQQLLNKTAGSYNTTVTYSFVAP